jgi:hypothetical protein
LQPFNKIPTDKAITVLSKVNPMYTAGGNDALIDGIIGTANWRAGEWQSYYGNDFEAVIDLKKVKTTNSISALFLQDTRSWIWMPKQLEVYSSNDGKNFSLVKTIANTVDEKDEEVKTYTMQLKDVNIKSRFIKIVAKNYGTIPSWHLGVGNPSHLFISEITVN